MNNRSIILAALVLAAGAAAHADSHGLIRITRAGSTLTLSQDHFGAILIDASRVTLDCRHHRLYVMSRSAPGVRATQGAAVKVGGPGGPMRTDVTVRNCIVHAGEGLYRYGILVENTGNVTIDGNTVVGRAALHALKLAGPGTLTVSNNVVHSSATRRGGAILVAGDNVSISGNTLQATRHGGAYAAIRATGASVSIVENTLTGCNAIDSVGIEVWNASGGTVLGNTITNFTVPVEIDDTAAGVVVEENMLI